MCLPRKQSHNNKSIKVNNCNKRKIFVIDVAKRGWARQVGGSQMLIKGGLLHENMMEINIKANKSIYKRFQKKFYYFSRALSFLSSLIPFIFIPNLYFF